MRTLLIDNYDSYTYNLYQLLAMVNGVEPVVLRNDAAEARRLDLAAFDNVVISPGPGHPERDRDFGVAAGIVARADIPVLGVCLGHQGIAAGAGGRVEPAPRARHGHLTRVAHDGRELFRGIPQGFTAVRYHSLRAREPFPDGLEATAWAEDGVNMGLRHRDRPLWGVQFHPESVETQFGRELVANFAGLTAAHRSANKNARDRPVIRVAAPAVPVAAQTVPVTAARTVPVTVAPGVPGARPAPDRAVRYRLHTRVLESIVDTEAAFGRLFGTAGRCFWLDSAYLAPGLARFSYLGAADGPLAEYVSYRVGRPGGAAEAGPGGVYVHRAGRIHRVAGNVFDYLQRELSHRVIDGPRLPFDFRGGYVGYFGYELKADCGSPNRYRSPTPDAGWLFVDRLVVVDHEEGRSYALALSDGSVHGAAEADAWLDGAVAVLSALPPGVAAVEGAGPGGGARVAGTARDRLERWLCRDRDRYLADIEACRRALLAGESYEVCLTNSLRVPAAGGGYDFYRRLRRLNPAPYAAYLKWDGIEVACSSPERFLKIGRDRTVEAKPIKGTAARGRFPEEDARLRASLLTSAKTRAENLMIVDLMRNDLGRVCEIGSVHVPRLMATESYATVHQLVSTVRGRLRPEVGVLDCVRACFPGGSMTGAPKLRTMEIIGSLETGARGIYSGAIGFLGCDGTADLNIVIRTAVLVDGHWLVGAGGAIVLDSDPVDEYEEMLLKADAPLRAYGGTVPEALTAVTTRDRGRARTVSAC